MLTGRATPESARLVHVADDHEVPHPASPVAARRRGAAAEIAARHGVVELDDLFDWIERYRSAGRDGLDGR
jgi:hypothetical protein